MSYLIEQETVLRWDQTDEGKDDCIYCAHGPTIKHLIKMGYRARRVFGTSVEFHLPKKCVKVKDIKNGGFEYL